MVNRSSPPWGPFGVGEDELTPSSPLKKYVSLLYLFCSSSHYDFSRSAGSAPESPETPSPKKQGVKRSVFTIFPIDQTLTIYLDVRDHQMPLMFKNFSKQFFLTLQWIY
jgi:hypothetical protein